LVELHVLQAFDARLWLRSADQVERRYGTSEATISRYRKRCLQVFDLAMERRQGEWELIGDTTFLLQEREVHQMLRWHQGSALRLDSQHWCSHLLAADLPESWMGGKSNFFEYQHPLELLQQGVIDSWPSLAGSRSPALLRRPGRLSSIATPRWGVSPSSRDVGGA
jgi:hypothetical protein